MQTRACIFSAGKKRIKRQKKSPTTNNSSFYFFDRLEIQKRNRISLPQHSWCEWILMVVEWSFCLKQNKAGALADIQICEITRKDRTTLHSRLPRFLVLFRFFLTFRNARTSRLSCRAGGHTPGRTTGKQRIRRQRKIDCSHVELPFDWRQTIAFWLGVGLYSFLDAYAILLLLVAEMGSVLR